MDALAEDVAVIGALPIDVAVVGALPVEVVVGTVFERVSVPATTTSPTGFGPAFGTTGFGPAFGTTGDAALLKSPDMAVYV